MDSPQRRYVRKVIWISAEESPNIRYARAQIAAGQQPTGQIDGEDILPGVISWDQLREREATWDEVLKEIGLRGRFWKGRDSLLYPPTWLNYCQQLARQCLPVSTVIGARNPYTGIPTSGRKWLGCDPAEGGDSSSWSIIDDSRLVEQLSLKTPDTNVVPRETIRLMDKWSIADRDVVFDRGGGGMQHADRLRDGFLMPDGQVRKYKNIRTVAFGEGMTPDPRKQRNRAPYGERLEVKEDRAAYANRRAEMYGEASDLIDPTLGGFAIDFTLYPKLRKQLAVIPRLYAEGKLYLPPKRRKPGEKRSNEKPTLEELIGHSPDEADSFVLAVYARNHEANIVIAGGVPIHS